MSRGQLCVHALPIDVPPLLGVDPPPLPLLVEEEEKKKDGPGGRLSFSFIVASSCSSRYNIKLDGLQFGCTLSLTWTETARKVQGLQ